MSNDCMKISEPLQDYFFPLLCRLGSGRVEKHHKVRMVYADRMKDIDATYPFLSSCIPNEEFMQLILILYSLGHK